MLGTIMIDLDYILSKTIEDTVLVTGEVIYAE